jgi:hypothetical protein
MTQCGVGFHDWRSVSMLGARTHTQVCRCCGRTRTVAIVTPRQGNIWVLAAGLLLLLVLCGLTFWALLV